MSVVVGPPSLESVKAVPPICGNMDIAWICEDAAVCAPSHLRTVMPITPFSIPFRFVFLDYHQDLPYSLHSFSKNQRITTINNCSHHFGTLMLCFSNSCYHSSCLVVPKNRQSSSHLLRHGVLGSLHS